MQVVVSIYRLIPPFYQYSFGTCMSTNGFFTYQTQTIEKDNDMLLFNGFVFTLNTECVHETITIHMVVTESH